MRRRRCLIPADGFDDWRDGVPRRPYFVRQKNSDGPMAFAGVWESWTGPNGEELDTAAIVTTRAYAVLAAVHDRMPVVVPPEAFNLWLDCAEVDGPTAAALIAPAPETLLEYYEVSTAVNRAANDDPHLIEPAASERPDRSDAAHSRTTPRSATNNCRCFRASLQSVWHFRCRGPGRDGCLRLLCLINQQRSAGRIIPAKCVTMARFRGSAGQSAEGRRGW